MTSSNFADNLGDEIANSQPISLPSSCEFDETSFAKDSNLNSAVTSNSRPPKYTGQCGQLRSIEEIDCKYRSFFNFDYFNEIQSNVIDDALYSDKSMVVCAPTGSGKTVVFEMAIVQLLMAMEDKKSEDDYKIIYMAPIKALCTERLTEWYPKLNRLGIMCIVVIGDTNVEFEQLKPYKVIITTPEKWDMITRRWRDHRGLVEMIKLFLIDEVHILNDESRGPVLEAVVSRMKTIETAARSAYRIEKLQQEYGNGSSNRVIRSSEPAIRFVAVSATVSNPEEVAKWLGSDEKPAVYYKFGDECRPVKLRRVVEGYHCPEGASIFKFDIILNYKLWPIIQKYHDGKPTLIFCNTRKSVILTAETLSKEITIGFTPEQKAKLYALASTIKNKKIQTLLQFGVGCHHAGLLYEERLTIEQGFRNRDIPILITTTTLAMGVNLPAHLVIIKNTQQYVNGAYQEYSISTVLQMVGRAGRPQFDTEATAVIMTRLCDKPRYHALVGGSEPLQSYLHKRLAENLNSEAALGTVTDVAQCVQWLRSTFLWVRAANDPKRYLGLHPAAPAHQICKKVEELCVKAMNGLASAGLITMDEASCIESTTAGRLMSIYYLDLETMKLIMKVEGSESLERLLWLICESHELSDMHLRIDERRTLNALNRNTTAATIRFPMKGKISTRQMKLNCMIQAVLGCLLISDPSLNQEAMKIMRTAVRVCKCLVAYLTRPEITSNKPKFFAAVLNSIILAKCMTANLWENSVYVSKQLKGIGPTFSTLLASAGKVNFMLLEESHPRDLERIMNKGPPAGNIVRKQISLLPKYQLTANPVDENTVSIQLCLINQAYLEENMEQLTAGSKHLAYILVGDSENNLLLFTSFNDQNLISVYDGTLKFDVNRLHNFEHKIFIHCISSDFVGIDIQCEYIFKDLNIQFIREEFGGSNVIDDWCKSNTPQRQTVITETFKERKRKNNTIDISQSKEKKKRDSAVIEKLNSLKASFNIASKEIKDDLHRSTEISNNILNDLVQPQTRNTFNKDTEYKTFDNNYLLHESSETPIDHTGKEQCIEDSMVNDILHEIEKEITKNNDRIDSAQCNVSSNFVPIRSEPIAKNASKLLVQPLYADMNNSKNKVTNIPRFNSKYKKGKKGNLKSNYSFIDLLEKNVEDSDDDVGVEPKKDSEFSVAIQSQITKYLDRQTISIPKSEAIPTLLQTDNNFNKNDDKPYGINANDSINKTEFLERDNIPERKDNNAIIASDFHEVIDIAGYLPDTHTNENYEYNKDNNNEAKYAINNNENAIENRNIDVKLNDGPCNVSLEIKRDVEMMALDFNKTINIADCVPSSNIKDYKNKNNKPSKDDDDDNSHNKACYGSHRNKDSKRQDVQYYRNWNNDDRENMLIPYLPETNNYDTSSATSLQHYMTSDHYTSRQYERKINESINKYTFSTTDIIVCTKEMPGQNIKVIRKLKVDVDITKTTRSEPTNNSSQSSDFQNQKNPSPNELDELRPRTVKLMEQFLQIQENSTPENSTHFFKINESRRTNALVDSSIDIGTPNPKTTVVIPLEGCDSNHPTKSETNVKHNVIEGTPVTENKDIGEKIAVCDDPYINNAKKPAENKGVDTILQKYSMVLKKNCKGDETNEIKNHNMNKKSFTSFKSKRQFTIKDIDKLQVTLPESFSVKTDMFVQTNVTNNNHENEDKNDWQNQDNPISENTQASIKLLKGLQTNNKQPDLLKSESAFSYNDITKNNTEDSQIPINVDVIDEMIPYPNTILDKPETENKPIDLSDDEDLPPLTHSISYENLESLLQDYKIDQSLLNPKTLLEYFSHDNTTDIIPPPEEFGDTGTPPMQRDPEEPIDPNYDVGNLVTNSSIIHTNEIDLTPTKEIETWMFSTEDKTVPIPSDLIRPYSDRPWTIARKQTSKMKSPFSTTLNSRQDNLDHFKYAKKPKFKFK